KRRNMNSKELYSIREWAPLTDVLDRIPTRINRGLFPADLNITCIDAVEEFFALGTDAGIVFWYNRQNGDIQKLKAETTTRITCVKIVDSVEYMVAAGNSCGQVNVFQIQKELPPDLNLVAPCTKSKPIERYTIRDLHHSAISCCEWSKNAMKLYSGDRNGVVVLTEFDYQAHISKSIEILSEAYEIVQLSAHQGFLLVSTLYRSIVCHRNAKSNKNDNWIVTQIGKKDRKQLVDCGGTFFKQSSSTSNGKRPRLICGRPNLRFWLADTEGNVEKTLLFREAVTQSPTWEIPILNPKFSMPNKTMMTSSQMHTEEELPAIGDARNFRNIYSYAGEDTLIVTHDERALYVLNLERLRVEAVAKGFRKIIDFCVWNKEIFVLEGERSLLRLAPMPEKPNKTAKIIYNPSLPPPVPILGSSICGSFEAPVEYEPEEQPVTNAEECFELPPIETLNLQIPIELAVESSKAEQNRRLEVFKEISEMDFDDDILHHSGILNARKKRHKSRNSSRDNQKQTGGIVEIGHAVVQDEKEEGKAVDNNKEKVEFTTTSTKMEASFCSKEKEECNSSSTMGLSLKEAFSQHLPNILSPTTLKNTIAEKAKTLAEELDLPEVSLQPITDEELRLSKYLSQAPAPQPPQHISALATVYPTENNFKDSSIQTTPMKKIYYIEEQNICDFSDGQPIEDICQTLRATNIVESNNLPKQQNEKEAANKPLKFINTQPENNYEIDSFLLDFKRAGDPLSKLTLNTNLPPPATSGKSENESSTGSSSEWEFLDN
ncbi:WD repeat-containing protein, partial [Lucilia cuprina]